MAAFSSSRYLLALFLLNLYLKVLQADPNLTFSFKNFGKDSNFESQLALFGDSKVASDNTSVIIHGSLICKKPINLVEVKSRKMVSFTSNFVFSLSRENGYGLAFVMLPFGFFSERKIKFLEVEFDTSKDEKYGDVNDNHVGLNVYSLVSVKVSNVSSINLVLNTGEKLQSWIDYEASGKRIEVRLRKFGDNKPLDPLLSYPIDLSKMWKDENVTIGLTSSSQNSSQQCIVYSWSFKSRATPHWMHSEPMDPNDFVAKQDELKVPKRSNCALRILAALVFGTGCGALGAFLVLFLWTMFGNRRPVVPEEFSVRAKEFGYKKFDVNVDNTVEDGKKVGA